MRMKVFLRLYRPRLLGVILPFYPQSGLSSGQRIKSEDLRLDIICLLCPLWTGMTQSLACQEFFCADYMIEAFRTEATLESIVPHLELSPLSADCAVI